MGIIYENAGEQDKAIDAYDRFVSAPQYDAMGENSGMVGPVLERLAELYAELGDPDRAIAALTRLIKRWENADAVLQPRVRAAQERLDELLVRQAREPDGGGG